MWNLEKNMSVETKLIDNREQMSGCQRHKIGVGEMGELVLFCLRFSLN